MKQWAKQNYKMNLFQKRKGTFTIQQDGKQVSPQELTALKLNMKLCVCVWNLTNSEATRTLHITSEKQESRKENSLKIQWENKLLVPSY